MSRIPGRTCYLVMNPAIGLAIAASGEFLTLRAWVAKISKESSKNNKIPKTRSKKQLTRLL